MESIPPKQAISTSVQTLLKRHFEGLDRLYTYGSKVALPRLVGRHYGHQKIDEERFPQEYWQLGTYQLPNSNDLKPLVLSTNNVEETRTYLDAATLENFTPNQLKRYALNHADYIFKTKAVQSEYNFLRAQNPRRGLPDLNAIRDGQLGVDLRPFILNTGDHSFSESELRRFLELSQQTYINPIRSVQVSHEPVIINNSEPDNTLASRFHTVMNARDHMSFQVPPPKHPLFFPHLADRYAKLYKEGIEESFELMSVLDQQRYFNQYYKPYYDKNAFTNGMVQALPPLLGLESTDSNVLYQRVRQLNELHILNKESPISPYDLVRLWFFDWPFSSNLTEIDSNHEMFTGYIVEQLKLFDVDDKGRVGKGFSTVDYIVVDPSSKPTKKTRKDAHGNSVDVITIASCNLAVGHSEISHLATLAEGATGTRSVLFDAARSTQKHEIQPFDVGADSDDEDDVREVLLDDNEDEFNPPSMKAFLEGLHTQVTQTLNKLSLDLTTAIQRMNDQLFNVYKGAPHLLDDRRHEDEMKELFRTIDVKLTDDDINGGYKAYESVFRRYETNMSKATALLEVYRDGLEYYIGIEDPRLAKDPRKVETFTHEKQQMLVDKLMFILHDILGNRRMSEWLETTSLDKISQRILDKQERMVLPIFERLAKLRDDPKSAQMFDDDVLDKLLRKKIIFQTQSQIDEVKLLARVQALREILQDVDLNTLEEGAKKDVKSAKKTLSKDDDLPSLKKLDKIQASLVSHNILTHKKAERHTDRKLTTIVLNALQRFIEDRTAGVATQLGQLANPQDWSEVPESERLFFEAVRKTQRTVFIRKVEATLEDLKGSLSPREQLILSLQSSLRLILGINIEELPQNIYPTQGDLEMMLADTLLRPVRMQELIDDQKDLNRKANLQFKNFGNEFYDANVRQVDSDSDDDSDDESSTDFDLEVEAHIQAENSDSDINSDSDSDSDQESEDHVEPSSPSSASSSSSSSSDEPLEEEDNKDDEGTYDFDEDSGFFENFDFSVLSEHDLKDPAAFYVVNQVCFHLACILRNHAMIALSNLYDELFKWYHVVLQVRGEDDAAFPTPFVENLIAAETNPTIQPVLANISALIQDPSKEMTVFEFAADAAYGLVWETNSHLIQTDAAYRCLNGLHQYLLGMFLRPRTNANIAEAMTHLRDIYDFGQTLYLASALVALRSSQYVELPVEFGDHLYSVMKACARRKDDRGATLAKVKAALGQASRARQVYQSTYNSGGVFTKRKEPKPKEVVPHEFAMINPLGGTEVDLVTVEKVRHVIQGDMTSTFVTLLAALKDKHRFINERERRLIKGFYVDDKENPDRKPFAEQVQAPLGDPGFARMLITLSFMFGHPEDQFCEAAIKVFKDAQSRDEPASSSSARIRCSLLADEARDRIRAITTGMMVLLPVMSVYDSATIEEFMFKWMGLHREFQSVLDVIYRDHQGLLIQFDEDDPTVVTISNDPFYPKHLTVQPGAFSSVGQFLESMNRFFDYDPESTSNDARYRLKIDDQPRIPQYVFENEMPEGESSVHDKPLGVYMDTSGMVRFFLDQILLDTPDDAIRSRGRRARHVKTGYKSLVKLAINRMQVLSAAIPFSQIREQSLESLRQIFPPHQNYYLTPQKPADPSRLHALVLSVAIDTITGLMDRTFVVQTTGHERKSGVVEALRVMFDIPEENALDAEALFANYLNANDQEAAIDILQRRIQQMEDFDFDSIKVLRPVYRIENADNLLPTGWEELQDLMIVYDHGTHFIIIVPHRSRDYIWARGNTFFQKREVKAAKRAAKSEGVKLGLRRIKSKAVEEQKDDDSDDASTTSLPPGLVDSDEEEEVKPSPLVKRKNVESPESQPDKKKPVVEEEETKTEEKKKKKKKKKEVNLEDIAQIQKPKRMRSEPETIDEIADDLFSGRAVSSTGATLVRHALQSDLAASGKPKSREGRM